MKQAYNTAYAAVCTASRSIDPYRDTRWLNRFTYYSANLEHFLPMLETGSHVERFRQTIAYEQLGALDVEWFLKGYTPAVVEHGPALGQTLARQPGIVCTMHTGAHLHIAFEMLKEKIPFAVLVSAAAKRALLEKRRDPWLLGASTSLIDAETPGALASVIRCLRSGTNVLALVDGGAGAAPLARSNALKTPFLGQHIYVRAGVPFAALRARVPIYPMWAFRRAADTIDLYHQQPIYVDDRNAVAYLRYAISEIYDHFSAYLLHHTAQWTNWWNIQRFIDATQYIRPPGRVLQQRFSVLMEASQRFVFDRDHYRIHRLREQAT